MEREDLGWARDLVARGAWLFHAETRVAGQAAELFDGVESRWAPGPDKSPIDSPVIRLHNGHALIARRGAFFELTDKDAVFACELEAGLASLVAAAARRGGELAVIPAMGATIIAAVLRAQMLQVERVFQR